MGELERAEIYLQISETLDNVDEIVENNDIDASDDEQFAEIQDLLAQIRSIIEPEE